MTGSAAVAVNDPGLARRSLAGRYLWDPWPVQDPNGTTVRVSDGELWVALVADGSGHPEDRHDLPRQHLLILTDLALRDLGPLFPEGSEGSREWSGSTIYNPADGVLTAYYTAAGRRGEQRVTHEQRIFAASTKMELNSGAEVCTWGPHRELFKPQPPYLDSGFAAPDRWLHGFRDPGWFRDPATGSEYLLVAASVDDDRDDGPWAAIALAERDGGRWVLHDPILDAVGWNRELERPHIVCREGRYYLFVSTQQHTFVGDQAGRTGLYGYVADSIAGPYKPVNETGLVLANPPDRPHEAYAWIVLDDLRVGAFLNYPDEPAGTARPRPDAAFAGGFAPFKQLRVQGDRIWAAPTGEQDT